MHSFSYCSRLWRQASLFLLLLLLSASQVSAQESGDHHAESDAYWARLAASYPPFVIEPSMIRVPAANELNTLGAWGPVLDWPHIPVSAAHLPDGRILTWASNEEDGFPGGQPEFTFAAAWDPTDESFKMVPHNSHDMFCAHQVMMEDGRLFVMGGRNTVNLTSIYDPTTDTWEHQEPMANGRWYPTAVGMPNGDVMIAVGSGGGSFPEVWNDNSGWRTLTGVNLNAPILDYTGYYENNWWPLLHVAPDGDVFHSGPTPDMHRINTAGAGSIVKTGPQITDWYPKHGTTVMYDEGKLLVAGGALGGGNLGSTNRSMTIDISGGTPIVTEVASMHHARKFQNGVMLPTGEVLVVGGNTSGTKFSDDGTVLAAEMWDPQTGLWTELADMSVPRNYHSVALLMTDGRVWVGGGGLCGSGCAANHMDAQIYSPSYLYNGDGSLASRPAITDAPESVRNGTTVSVDATAGLSSFSMIKMSSTTHGVNSDVRYLNIPFIESGSGVYDLDMHENMNVLTPGYWMLFGVDSNGVPSEAAVIQVSTEGVPQVTNPGTQISPEGDVVSLQIDATDDDVLTFSASGLPSGLSINSSGLISGTIPEGAAGSYESEVTVSDALGSVSVSFNWIVTTGATGQILREWWTDITGTDIPSLTNDADYPDNPDGSDFLTSFEAPADWADNYGTRIRGYIYPPISGDYTFWIATDDNGELWLSTDENPTNAAMIANVPGWTTDYEWDKFTEQQSSLVTLTAGERYYVEVLMKEGGGLDNIAVAWQMPGGSLEVIAGDFLSPYSGAPMITSPGDQTDFEGASVSLTVSASDPENDPLGFTATGLPSGLSISGDGIISGTIAEGAAGSHEVVVTVTDGVNDDTALFNWTVLEPAEAQGEVGIVSIDQTSSSQWHTVNLENEYQYPVVVMGPPSYSDTEPLSVRVQNVTSNSFEFQFDEWDYLDGVHGTESVAYLVMEAGTFTLVDGRIIQAGIADLTNSFSFINFNQAFDATPVVFSQVGSVNEASAVTTRQRNVNVSSFEAQLEEEEGSDATHASETVYWVAFDQGANAEGLISEAGLTGDEVEEFFHTISFTQSYSASPVFFASMQSTDGGDTATLRYNNLSGASADVLVEEEKSANDEVGHTTETVGYLVFNAAGQISFEGYEPPALVLADPGAQSGAEGEAASLAIVVEQDNGLPVTFTASGLPDGMSINSSSGVVSGGLVAGSAGTANVTVEATDGTSSGSVSFNWTVDAARGTWIDYNDDTNALSLTDDSEEKDIAVGDLNKDGWDDIVVVRKEGFMGTGARTDLLIMNEAGVLVDRTDMYAPGFSTEPTIARDAIIADLDGDGWDDVLIANTFGDQPSFYRNLGEVGGTWLGLSDESSARLPTLDTGSIQYCSVAAGDVNGDGALDLYFSNYVMDGTTDDVLLINDGNGNFADEGETRLGNLIDVAFGTQADIIDMDGDGDRDIVKLSANQPSGPFGTDGIFVLYNDGTGNFSDWSTVPSNEAYMYIIEDFDNNGEYDFYVVDDGADYVNLSSGVTENSNINFTQETTSWVRTAGHGANLRAGDLDGDGDLDIGVADVDTSEPPCEATDLRAFLLLENENSASGTFIDPFGAEDKPWSKNMYDFAFVDVNNDGNLDIFTAECGGYGLFTSTQDPVEPPADPVAISLGDLNHGIAAHDQRTGTGYIMYSEESVHTRFSATPPSAWNADHLIAVVLENGQWKVDRNKNTLVDFDARGSDLLVAEVDFGANTLNHLVGVSDVVQGITAGYTSGDLVIHPEMWDGASNAGEFWAEGTEIVVNGSGNSAPVLTAIGDQHNYVDDTVSLTLSASDANGDPVSFSASGLPSGLNLSGVTISGQPTTAGTYSVTITAMDGQGGEDYETFAWTIDGGTPGTTVTLALGDLNLGIATHDQRTGTGYIMFSEESIHTRFADNPPSAWNADHLIAVVFDQGVWKIDRNKYTLVAFTPLSTDLLVAEVDFGANTVDHLTGVNTVVDGISAGYVSGDLVITPEMWGGSPNEGEFGVEGASIEVSAEVAQGNRLRDQLVRQEEIPDEYALSSIYPNPFNLHTSIAYQLAEESNVTIEIFGMTGQRVRVLMNDHQMPAGYWQSIWDGTDDGGRTLAAGVYLIRFEANGYSNTGKVVLVK